MHWVKKHGKVLAVCDENVLGKKLGRILVDEKFYKGELVDEERLSELLKEHENINIIGKKSVNAAKKQGIACCAAKIKGVPHALIFKI
ncbi:MAG: DUF424 family protein [archaeon]